MICFPEVSGDDWLQAVLAVAPLRQDLESYCFGADNPDRHYFLTVFLTAAHEIGCMIRARNGEARAALVDLERTLQARSLPYRMEADGRPVDSSRFIAVAPGTWRLYFPRPD